MKKQLFLVLVGLLAPSLLGMGQRRAEDRFIFLDVNDTLQIEFNYMAPPEFSSRSPSIADEMEKQAERNFRKAISVVLETFEMPMAYRVLENNEKPEEGHPTLTISALRWEIDRFGELEAVVGATLKSYGERNSLASVRSTEPVFGIRSQDRLDQAYIAAMIKSLTEIMYELMDHFQVPVVEDESFPVE